MNIKQPIPFQPSASMLKQYCNWSEPQTLCLTFDIDFAPEFMVQNLISILKEQNVKATFFATHDSLILKKIGLNPNFEIGLHPNLAVGSTQGKTLPEIINRLRVEYPSAVGNRFHILGHSYRDLMLLQEYGFRYDVSGFRFNASHLVPCWHPDLAMTMLTYCWEDGVCENAGLSLMSLAANLDTPGIKIFNFHPLNVFLNAPDFNNRRLFLKACGNLTISTPDQVKPFCSGGQGARDALLQLIKAGKNHGMDFLRLTDLVCAFEEDIDVRNS